MNITLEQQCEDEELTDKLLEILRPEISAELVGENVIICGILKDGLELNAVVDSSEFADADYESGGYQVDLALADRALISENLEFLKEHYNLL